MRAVITVVGRDTVGILAKVSGICSESHINITEVSQTVMEDMFCMIMMADISESTVEFNEFADTLAKYGEEHALSIHVMHEDIFNSMHRI
jgi:ACT domain-containing protein